MKRVVFFALLSAMAVLIFATIALAQSSPDQRGSHQSIQGQKGMNQSIPDQVQSPDQNSPNQSSSDQGQYPDQSSSDPAGGNSLTVHISNNAFDPTPLDVPPKTTVTWVNDDTAPHTATSDEGKLFDSGALEPGQTYSVWFDGSGTVTYHSKLDPDMQGTLIVGGSTSGGNTTAPGNTKNDTTQPTGSSSQPTGGSTQPVSESTTQPAVGSTQPTGNTTGSADNAQQPVDGAQTTENTQTTGDSQTAEYNQTLHTP